MGRHAASGPGAPGRGRPRLPWEVIGWCVFAGVVAVVVLLALGETAAAALLVLGAGVAAVVVIVALSLITPRSGVPSDRPGDPL